MSNFDVFFSLLGCKKRKTRSHGKWKNGYIKRTICADECINISLKDILVVLNNLGRHGLLSMLSSLPTSVSRNLESEANKFLIKLTHHITQLF